MFLYLYRYDITGEFKDAWRKEKEKEEEEFPKTKKNSSQA